MHTCRRYVKWIFHCCRSCSSCASQRHLPRVTGILNYLGCRFSSHSINKCHSCFLVKITFVSLSQRLVPQGICIYFPEATFLPQGTMFLTINRNQSTIHIFTLLSYSRQILPIKKPGLINRISLYRFNQPRLLLNMNIHKDSSSKLYCYSIIPFAAGQILMPQPAIILNKHYCYWPSIDLRQK